MCTEIPAYTHPNYPWWFWGYNLYSPNGGKTWWFWPLGLLQWNWVQSTPMVIRAHWTLPGWRGLGFWWGGLSLKRGPQSLYIRPPKINCQKKFFFFYLLDLDSPDWCQIECWGSKMASPHMGLLIMALVISILCLLFFFLGYSPHKSEKKKNSNHMRIDVYEQYVYGIVMFTQRKNIKSNCIYDYKIYWFPSFFLDEGA